MNAVSFSALLKPQGDPTDSDTGLFERCSDEQILLSNSRWLE